MSVKDQLTTHLQELLLLVNKLINSALHHPSQQQQTGGAENLSLQSAAAIERITINILQKDIAIQAVLRTRALLSFLREI